MFDYWILVAWLATWLQLVWLTHLVSKNGISLREIELEAQHHRYDREEREARIKKSRLVYMVGTWGGKPAVLCARCEVPLRASEYTSDLFCPKCGVCAPVCEMMKKRKVGEPE